MILIERANETNDNTMPDKNILAILYDEISKDPREALRITGLNCQEQQVPLEEVLTRLLSSAGAAPMNRTVKIHSMESKTVTPICFRFQVNKCPFGDKCKHRYIKDHNFISRQNKENKDNNRAGKKIHTQNTEQENSHPIIIIIVLLVLQEENHLMDMLHRTQQCKLEP